MHEAVGLHREVHTASVAAEGLRLRPVLNVVGLTTRALYPVRPTLVNEPLMGEVGVCEHLYGLNQRETLAVVLTWCVLCHDIHLCLTPDIIPCFGVNCDIIPFPNQGGVLAALLAQEGLGAHCDALEGQAGFFAMFYDGVYDASVITEGLGTTYYTLDSSFKPWPTSGLIHAFIEAGLQLRNNDGVGPEDIVELRLTGHPSSRNWFEPVEERQQPSSAASAANSVYFGAAKALANGAVTLSDFTPEGLGQQEALQLAAKGSHELDDSLSPHAGTVEVVLRSGATVTRRIDLPLGHPARPLSHEQLVDKFMDCASHAPLPLSHAALESVVDLIDRLEDLEDVAAIPEALSRQ